MEAKEPLDPLEVRLHKDVETFGWSVLKVMGEPDWAYSIGVFHSIAKPEVCIFGLDLDDCHALVNQIVERMTTPYELQIDSDYTGLLADERRCRLVLVSAEHYQEYFGRALDFYRYHPFPVVQLLWSDEQGRYPNEEGYTDGHLLHQPYLGEIEVGDE